MNLVDRLNAAIADFVGQPENADLRPATGGYSTPFRGQLFGHLLAKDVEAELRCRSAAILFLGSNPNCPGSLNLLRARNNVEGHWPEFERQMSSGYFGERVVDDSGALRAWDPINSPPATKKGRLVSWTFYAEAFREGGAPLDEIAMANVFSWGSGELHDLINHLANHDHRLLDRVIEFANDQLRAMVSALRPGLLICPRSVSDHRVLQGLLVSTTKVTELMDVSAEGLEGRPFRIHLARASFSGRQQQVLYLNHPSALRWHRASDRSKIGTAMIHAIRSGLERANSLQ